MHSVPQSLSAPAPTLESLLAEAASLSFLLHQFHQLDDHTFRANFRQGNLYSPIGSGPTALDALRDALNLLHYAEPIDPPTSTISWSIDTSAPASLASILDPRSHALGAVIKQRITRP